MNRRDAPKGLLALPLLASSKSTQPIAVGERRKFRRVSRGSVPCDVFAEVNRINSAPWRGNLPNTVRIESYKWERKADGSHETLITVVGIEPFYAIICGAKGEGVQFIVASRIYGDVDFNGFEFGEPVEKAGQ